MIAQHSTLLSVLPKITIIMDQSQAPTELWPMAAAALDGGSSNQHVFCCVAHKGDERLVRITV